MAVRSITVREHLCIMSPQRNVTVASITIRCAAVRERKALEALQLRASLANPGDKPALLSNPDAIELPEDQLEAGRVFVAEANGAVVGFAVLLPRDDGDSDLDGLFVEPSSWGQGIGRQLVEHCARVARTEGSVTLHVVGNPHAEGFYLRCGFVRSGTAETRFGVGLLLRKRI